MDAVECFYMVSAVNNSLNSFFAFLEVAVIENGFVVSFFEMMEYSVMKKAKFVFEEDIAIVMVASFVAFVEAVLVG